RAARAGRVPVRVEHDVLDDELAAIPEQAGQRDLALRAFERVLLADPDHRQPPPLRVQRVTAAGVFLFRGEQPLPGCQPLLARYDLGIRHVNLPAWAGDLRTASPMGRTRWPRFIAPGPKTSSPVVSSGARERTARGPAARAGLPGNLAHPGRAGP